MYFKIFSRYLIRKIYPWTYCCCRACSSPSSKANTGHYSYATWNWKPIKSLPEVSRCHWLSQTWGKSHYSKKSLQNHVQAKFSVYPLLGIAIPRALGTNIPLLFIDGHSPRSILASCSLFSVLNITSLYRSRNIHHELNYRIPSHQGSPHLHHWRCWIWRWLPQCMR